MHVARVTGNGCVCVCHCHRQHSAQAQAYVWSSSAGLRQGTVRHGLPSVQTLRLWTPTCSPACRPARARRLERLRPLTRGVGGRSPALSWIQLTDEQALETQQQVQGGGSVSTGLLHVQAGRDPAGHVLQPGHGLGSNVPAEQRGRSDAGACPHGKVPAATAQTGSDRQPEPSGSLPGRRHSLGGVEELRRRPNTRHRCFPRDPEAAACPLTCAESQLSALTPAQSFAEYLLHRQAHVPPSSRKTTHPPKSTQAPT